jgi:ribonuclease HI
MKVNDSEGLALYTDGSCDWTDRTGGWAWVAVDAFDGHEEGSGRFEDTTVNRMELYAVADGLTAIHRAVGPSSVLVHSDSEYVVLGASDPTRKRAKNKDLWKDLDKAMALHDHVEFTHVRGHKGDKYNELADDLAGAARKRR